MLCQMCKINRYKTGETFYHAHLGFSDKGCAIKESFGWVTKPNTPRCLDRKEEFGSPYLSLVVGPDVTVS